MSTTPSTTTSSSPDDDAPNKPWYSRGGMHVNEVGMGINITVPLVVLAMKLEPEFLRLFLLAILVNITLAVTVFQMRTLFCVAVVPIYMTSMMLAASMKHHLFLAMAVLVIAIYKVAVPMSACLHRYSAHAAFKCGPCTRFAMGFIASSASQGGPIWWASQHRMHHKFCDGPRDPHSCSIDGTENAFAFFMTHNTVEEEFAPKHMEDKYMRILDTWSFLVSLIEMTLAYVAYGREGLFVSYTSSWICQTITLWFNVCNHPPNLPKKCKAVNSRAKPNLYYPPFWFLDLLYPLFGAIVQEENHADHHDHSTLAKRCWWDVAYWGFIKPLEIAGLVWDVKVFDKEE